MISVRSHRPRLNGSNLCFYLLLLSLLFACSTPKSGAKKPGDTPSDPKETEDKVRVYDPATGTYVLVPRDAVKVDTVKWTEDKTTPIITDKKEQDEIDLPAKKSSYDISLLIPLNST